jgi:hypothetical protein
MVLISQTLIRLAHKFRRWHDIPEHIRRIDLEMQQNLKKVVKVPPLHGGVQGVKAFLQNVYSPIPDRRGLLEARAGDGVSVS